MKQTLHFLIFGLFLMVASCQKENETVDNPIVTDPTDVLVAKGTFSSNAHTTSGTIELMKKQSGEHYLNFKDFKTDAGPDLRIYLSADLGASTFTEVSSEVKNGNYQLTVPAGTNTSIQKYVLIWCKQFSVLFGNAELKP